MISYTQFGEYHDVNRYSCTWLYSAFWLLFGIVNSKLKILYKYIMLLLLKWKFLVHRSRQKMVGITLKKQHTKHTIIKAVCYVVSKMRWYHNYNLTVLKYLFVDTFYDKKASCLLGHFRGYWDYALYICTLPVTRPKTPVPWIFFIGRLGYLWVLSLADSYQLRCRCREPRWLFLACAYLWMTHFGWHTRVGHNTIWRQFFYGEFRTSNNHKV